MLTIKLLTQSKVDSTIHCCSIPPTLYREEVTGRLVATECSNGMWSRAAIMQSLTTTSFLYLYFPGVSVARNAWDIFSVAILFSTRSSQDKTSIWTFIAESSISLLMSSFDSPGSRVPCRFRRRPRPDNNLEESSCAACYRKASSSLICFFAAPSIGDGIQWIDLTNNLSFHLPYPRTFQ